METATTVELTDFVMIDTIVLNNVLPCAFRERGNFRKNRTSQIWEVPSFVFHKGCRICVQAESGGGKSSLLSYIYGNRTDYEGQICFDDRNVRTFRIGQWCELRTVSIALLPQELRLFPELTVLQNIEIKNHRTNHKTPKQICRLLERLGIGENADDLVGRLSIGQQQRVAFIRALCQPFDFIFLDEPVSHLDIHNNEIMAAIVEEEAASQGAGVVVTSVGNPLFLENLETVMI